MSRRPFTPKVVTANALKAGDAVWLTEDDEWSGDIAEAELIEDEAIAEDRLLFAIAQSNIVVGAYLAEARPGERGPEPAGVGRRASHSGRMFLLRHRRSPDDGLPGHPSPLGQRSGGTCAHSRRQNRSQLPRWPGALALLSGASGHSEGRASTGGAARRPG